MNSTRLLSAKSIKLFLLTLVLACLFGFEVRPSINTSASAANQTMNYSIYLPLIKRDYNLPTIFGISLSAFSPAAGFSQIITTNTSWTRRDYSWNSVEPIQGQRNWSAVSSLENDFIIANQNHLNVSVIIGDTPAWALKPGFICGAVDATKLAAFGQFVYDVVSRYHVAPYGVKYWELWNEPDVYNELGCWGQPGDPYYGGGYYGQMLKVAYPMIKKADPSAQVMVGGLLLDCDPVNPPETSPGIFRDCTASKFLEGALVNGAGPYFDGVSFHAYDYYIGDLSGQEYFNPNWHSAWNTTGPVMGAKVDYIRSVLTRYNFPNKFVMDTESALLCDICTTSSIYYNDFQSTKVDYVVESYVMAIEKGLLANIWYNAKGWRNSGLLNNDTTPLPAFLAYSEASQLLGWASFLGKITASDIGSVAGVTGDKFKTITQKEVWVLWSLDGAPHFVTLPRTPHHIWDATGNPITPTGTIQTTVSPIYIQFEP